MPIKLNYIISTGLIAIMFYTNSVAQQRDATQLTELGLDTLNVCETGNQYLAKYQFKEAKKALKRCYLEDTTNIDCLKKIALCSNKLGQLKDAKSIYSQIVEMDSTNLTALNQLGLLYQKESNYKKSLSQYKKLATLDSLNSYYHKKIAELSLKMGAIPNALFGYLQTHQLNPTDVEVIMELSKLYKQMEFYEKADSLIQKGISLDSTNIKLRLLLAKSAYTQKKYATVIRNLQPVMALTKDTSSYVLKLLGVSSFHVKDYAQAIHSLNKVVDSKQASEIIHYYLGLAYKASNKFKLSTQHFEEAITLGISDNVPTYYTNLAISLEEQGKHGAAIKAYQAAYKSSENKILLYHLARNYDAYYENKQTALQYYERYVAANDTDNIKFKDYSNYRISELKQILHFDIDTVD